MARPFALALHEVPDALVPAEPRLGGACAPVPAARFAALRSTGSVLLGRRPDDRHVVEFTASVAAELRALLQVPDGHVLAIASSHPDRVRRLIAAQPWAAGLEVAGAGPAAADWREAAAPPPPPGTPPPDSLAVVAGEEPDWRDLLAGAAPGTRLVAELSDSASPLTEAVVGRVDVGLLCPARLLGTGTGTTVVVVSPRAAAEAPRLRGALDEASAAVSTGDLVMLAQAVRSTAESDLASAAAELASRYARVAEWAEERAWTDSPPAPRGGELTVRLSTILPPAAVADIGAFLEAAHLAYGLTDPADPGTFRIGLYGAVRTEDIERLLGLLDFVVERSSRAPGQEAG